MSLEIDFSDVNENAGTDKTGYQRAVIIDTKAGTSKNGHPNLELTFELSATGTRVKTWFTFNSSATDDNAKKAFAIAKENIVRILSNKYQKSFKDTALELKSNGAVMCNLEVALLNIDMFVDIERDDFYNIKYFYAYGEQNRATKERKTKTKSKAASAQGSSTLQQQLAVDDTPF